MNFICEKNDFLNTLQIISKAISAKNTLPVLGGILIIAENGLLTLRSTNLDIAIECVMPADVKKGGQTVAADGRRFIEIIRQLPDGIIDISLINDFDLNIKYNEASMNIRGIDPEQFPILPAGGSEIQGVISGEVFSDLVRKTAIAAANDESRPVLTGIMLDFEPENINMVATDSHRLAFCTSPWQGNNSQKIIVPARTMTEVAKIAVFEENISLSINKNNVCFKMGNTTFISRIINGQFPDYKPIIPQEENYKYRVFLDKHLFNDALSRANLLSRDNNNIIKLILEKDALTVLANSPEVGNIEEKIAATVIGEDLTIGYNVRYVLDALKVISSETVALKLTGPLTPGVIVAEEEENYIYLLLPVRISA
jgi:DNA polymerase-3 subunit beta